MPSEKRVTVIFVTSGTEKMRKKVEDFLFLPICSLNSNDLPGKSFPTPLNLIGENLEANILTQSYFFN